MRRTSRLRAFLADGALALLLGAPLASDAFIVSANGEQEVSPSVAYDTDRDEYLVVWSEDRLQCDDIRAQRISSEGALLGDAFDVSAGCPADRSLPDVAYDGVHDQYLVVWAQHDPSSGSSIQARRVSGAGAVVDASDLEIRNAGANLYTPGEPAVAYASWADRYLVVWSETWHPAPITHGIYGQVVTSSGSSDGSSFPVSEGSEAREAPDVTYDRDADRYLVVWQTKPGDLWDVHGRQVHGGGGVYQDEILIAYYTSSSTAPRVAAMPGAPDDDAFMVVFEQHYATDRDIHAQLVARDGTVVTDFPISNFPLSDESAPAIAASEGDRHYRVLWRNSLDPTGDTIRGRICSDTGTLEGPILDVSGVASDHPALAAGSGRYLLAWQDQLPSYFDTDIFGRVVPEPVAGLGAAAALLATAGLRRRRGARPLGARRAV